MMIIIFMISFGAWLFMMLAGFIGSIDYSFNETSLDRKVRKMRLRRHWIRTWILFAIAMWAGISL